MGVGLIKNEDSSFTMSTMENCIERGVTSSDSIESQATINQKAENKLSSN